MPKQLSANAMNHNLVRSDSSSIPIYHCHRIVFDGREESTGAAVDPRFSESSSSREQTIYYRSRISCVAIVNAALSRCVNAQYSQNSAWLHLHTAARQLVSDESYIYREHIISRPSSTASSYPRRVPAQTASSRE